MDIKPGNIVMIKPTHDACSRTKNCIIEYGKKGFEIVSFNPRSQRFGGTPAILVRAISGMGTRYDKWLGWIPLLEVNSDD